LAQRAKRKKKRKPRPPARREPAMSRGYAKAEAKNAAVRQSLEPLAVGERPLPVTIGAIVALALAVVEIPLYLAWDGDERPALPGFLFFTGLMLLMAWGMWRVRYWAVLGFQALLAICILIFSLLALRFESVLDLLIALAVIVPGSVLFWFMVKAMARIQMPNRP
jgi:hypothetical protein